MLMMSATPIPRTLAMSYYADLDVSTIDELPPGRTPVVTKLIADARREQVIERIRAQIAAGRQVYWVCPLIEESEAFDLTNATATHEAMQDAALSDPKDVHLVMVKVPGLTTASIKDAESRGKTVVSHDLTFGPEGAGVYANDAAALGVAMALGEVPESRLADDVVRRNWDLYSEVAMTSSGGEKRHGEVVVFGNSSTSQSPLRIGHSVTRDFIDADGVRNALRAAGLQFKDGLPDEKDLDRLVHVFAKSVIPGSDQVRGHRITLLDDVHAYEIGKALGGMLVASVTGRTTNYVSGGERNSHQGPPGGNIVAAVVRAES